MKTRQKESGIIPDIDFGVQYQQIRKIYVGLSGTNLLESSADIGNTRYGPKRNLYLTAGYYINLMGKRKNSLYLIPSLLVKSNLANVQFDLTARLEYNNLLWAGVSYRYQDAVAVLAGVNIKGFHLGASYDFTIGNLSNISNGSPEIFIGYCYTLRPPEKQGKIEIGDPKVKYNSLYNTRYL